MPILFWFPVYFPCPCHILLDGFRMDIWVSYVCILLLLRSFLVGAGGLGAVSVLAFVCESTVGPLWHCSLFIYFCFPFLFLVSRPTFFIVS